MALEGKSSTLVEEYPVIWLQTSTCTGCSVSVLNSVSPTIKNVLVDEVIPGKHINLRFHATIMAGAGDPAIEVMEETAKEKKGGYILVVEGAIPHSQRWYIWDYRRKEGEASYHVGEGGIPGEGCFGCGGPGNLCRFRWHSSSQSQSYRL